MCEDFLWDVFLLLFCGSRDDHWFLLYFISSFASLMRLLLKIDSVESEKMVNKRKLQKFILALSILCAGREHNRIDFYWAIIAATQLIIIWFLLSENFPLNFTDLLHLHKHNGIVKLWFFSMEFSWIECLLCCRFFYSTKSIKTFN